MSNGSSGSGMRNAAPAIFLVLGLVVAAALLWLSTQQSINETTNDAKSQAAILQDHLSKSQGKPIKELDSSGLALTPGTMSAGIGSLNLTKDSFTPPYRVEFTKPRQKSKATEKDPDKPVTPDKAPDVMLIAPADVMVSVYMEGRAVRVFWNAGRLGANQEAPESTAFVVARAAKREDGSMGPWRVLTRTPLDGSVDSYVDLGCPAGSEYVYGVAQLSNDPNPKLMGMANDITVAGFRCSAISTSAPAKIEKDETIDWWLTELPKPELPLKAGVRRWVEVPGTGGNDSLYVRVTLEMHEIAVDQRFGPKEAYGSDFVNPMKSEDGYSELPGGYKKCITKIEVYSGESNTFKELSPTQKRSFGTSMFSLFTGWKFREYRFDASAREWLLHLADEAGTVKTFDAKALVMGGGPATPAPADRPASNESGASDESGTSEESGASEDGGMGE